MANYCYYSMRITGIEAGVNELIKMMERKEGFENRGLGTQIVSVDEYEREKHNDDLITVHLTGDCGWSVLGSMRAEYNPISLESESERLKLVIEVFSEETGNEFQEHFLVNKGEVLIDKYVDYSEHLIDEYKTIEEYNQEHGTTFTEDMIDDNRICVGGFGDDYGNFQFHLQYFKSA